MVSLEEKVANRIRRQIIKGEIEPGSRLPDRQELSRRYGISIPVLQGVIDRLVQQKYIIVGARKLGTRVAEILPNQYRYKLIFPGGKELVGTFFQALQSAAEKMTLETFREITFFYGLNGHQDISAYREIVDEVNNEQLAGLIFASSAEDLRKTPLIQQNGIPRVLTGEPSCEEMKNIPHVAVDFDDFMDRAIGFLRDRGCHRIALLTNNSLDLYQRWERVMNRHDLPINPVDVQFIDSFNPLGASHALQLMFHNEYRSHPDGLILVDDNFVKSAIDGLVASGKNVPDDLKIVSLVNYPNHTETELPITRLGFDVNRMLEALIGCIDSQRRGCPPAGPEMIPAVFEDEYKQLTMESK